MPELQHISNFLMDIHDECATLRDMKLSFWQVEIPYHARVFYRFEDNDHRVFEMCRLPMGHVCSPELMQILCSVLAGDPSYCNEEHSLHVPNRRVWIDNIRLSGMAAEMRQAAVWLDKNARALGVSWNAEESRTAVSEYDFLGGVWNHKTQQIEVSSKHRQTFAKGQNASICFHRLEALVGRLVYFSGMLQILTGRYYWVMKWFRRKANAFNRKQITDSELFRIPTAILYSMRTWIKEC
ncbi:MAG: hypothetical protein Q7T55_06275, partial [Solirubrobacteraceae bacterium]|nr:hypothetical protein [Solirubrobacteraceae bacterium]